MWIRHVQRVHPQFIYISIHHHSHMNKSFLNSILIKLLILIIYVQQMDSISLIKLQGILNLNVMHILMGQVIFFYELLHFLSFINMLHIFANELLLSCVKIQVT